MAKESAVVTKPIYNDPRYHERGRNNYDPTYIYANLDDLVNDIRIRCTLEFPDAACVSSCKLSCPKRIVRAVSHAIYWLDSSALAPLGKADSSFWPCLLR